MLRSTLVVLMLESFGDSVGVADFRAVLPVARLNRSVIDSFSFLFMPMMARLLVRDDSRSVNELFWSSTLWISVLSFPGFAATFCLARPVTILLFEERYAASASVLALLSVGMFFSASIGLNATAMKAAGYVRQIVLLDAAATLALVVLNVLLLPRYGALGGAVAFLVATVVHTAAYQVLLARHTGIRFLPRECAAAFAVMAGAVAALGLIQALWSPPLLIGLLLVALASAGVLAAGARLLDVEATFPELLRVPVVAAILRRLARKGTGSLGNGS
jgi:O-antigen/teichoic acid export membrane protein